MLLFVPTQHNISYEILYNFSEPLQVAVEIT